MNKIWIKILLLAIIGEALIFATPHFVYAAPISLDPNYSVSLLTDGLSGPANGVIFRSATNDLLVSEYNANRVSRIDAATGAVSLFAFVEAPDEMAINSKGEVFVKTHRASGPINRFDSNGNSLGSFTPFSGFPTGIAFDVSDNFYIAESTTNIIWKFAKGTFTSPTVFASGLPNLEGIAFSPSGKLFATDQINGNVYQVTPGGTTMASHILWASGLLEPRNFAFDPISEDLFFGDWTGRIFRSSSPSTFSVFATGFSNSPGIYDLDFDTVGNLYVDDFTQGEVWKFTRKGVPPTPFLDLPWDYEGKGLSFNEAALSMTSYFDHTYPLLSSGLSEDNVFINQITTFQNENSTTKNYSSHDGYDYGRIAKANLGDPVLAAAPGAASYVNSCGDCGNMIVIDHGNGYQTRYLHLEKDGLITNLPGEKVSVSARQQIGRVGATGNVSPSGALGAHIHFGVFEDKNKDGNFEDNILDGVTDPFGWQSTVQDPWETFTFFYNGLNRTGNRSYYLWKKKIDKLNATLTANGGVFNTGRYKVEFPQDATNKNLDLNILSEPIVKLSKEIQSIGSTISITASDLLGNVVTNFQKFFDITADFSSFDLTRYNTDTMSIYSSTDGVNWIKEPTIVDLLTFTATTQVDHLTHFALMAERKDTIPPTTTAAAISGQQGQPNWFRSDVGLALDSKDNDNGLGVDYTLYKIETTENTTDWTTYKIPLTFTTEGHHKIEFYSVDKDENVESVKSIEFDIDKTAPYVSIDANPKEIWPPNGKMIDVTITGSVTDDHLFSKIFIVEDEYDLVEPTISDFGQTIQLQARRDGSDKDGRRYIIKVVAQDLAGNIAENQTQVIIPHDKGKKKK